MTTNKDFKRLVRARMEKTGEAYTAARVSVIRKSAGPTTSVNYAAIAGMSDAQVKAKTGCTWERWVVALDHSGAATLSHGEIAAMVRDKFKIGPWWTQTVTVGYERIKGLRARGQQRNGTYQATKSRTYNVPVTTLFEAWANAATRKRWLDGAKVKVRTATAPKSMRLDWTDGSILAVGFAAKGAGKSTVAVEHTKLPDKAAVIGIKSYWAERLDMLGEMLEPAGNGTVKKRKAGDGQLARRG